MVAKNRRTHSGPARRLAPTEGQRNLEALLRREFGSLERAAGKLELSYSTVRALVQDGKRRRLDYQTVEKLLALGAEREWLPLL